MRRIEAVTGPKAEEKVYVLEDMLDGMRQALNNPAVVESVQKLLAENEQMRKRLDEAKTVQIEALSRQIQSELREESGALFFVHQIDMPGDYLKDLGFGLRAQVQKLVLIVGSVTGDKAMLSIALGDQIVARGIDASQVVREAAKEIQGSGGGQKFFATAGGKEPAGIERAMIAARELILNQLK